MKKNIEQEKAIAQLEGPVILISCPGSGKTTTLLRRINHMLEVGIPPKKILMITFTKAAAGFPGYPYITGRGGRGKAAVLCCSHKGKGKIIYHLCREQKRQTGIPFRQGASAQGKRTG